MLDCVFFVGVDFSALCFKRVHLWFTWLHDGMFSLLCWHIVYFSGYVLLLWALGFFWCHKVIVGFIRERLCRNV